MSIQMYASKFDLQIYSFPLTIKFYIILFFVNIVEEYNLFLHQKLIREYASVSRASRVDFISDIIKVAI